MEEVQPLSIEDAFGELRDPRSRTPAHDLKAMLLIALCAILSGADSWVAIQIWGEQKLEWLRRHTPLPHGIPSHDTFGRVFAALNARQFEVRLPRIDGRICSQRCDVIDPPLGVESRVVHGRAAGRLSRP
ncbi:transposase family protein [Burkholderia ubonensis]|uniref:H repeat-associated protein N-terminal domain-containing protein n=1 Tax=Burkholderia ubonensis TaxID=101571 RepID=A0A119H509_9BURK|nr:transposase family protein [Burkholderia ubonensis]KVZ32623.1 hypothetical protein WL16_11940 [Burkholderia ubonensis]KWA67394.1 hypothetical protein WL29_10450 [Burkholderia ubonensis]KWB93177.1 hypothetical protein WL43_02015 [Burkholderia ubonensis]KWZ58695.1 hypothetical protein WK57_16410 [Burkholderia ubonensis]